MIAWGRLICIPVAGSEWPEAADGVTVNRRRVVGFAVGLGLGGSVEIGRVVGVGLRVATGRGISVGLG
jgi:hypothetical protein